MREARRQMTTILIDPSLPTAAFPVPLRASLDKTIRLALEHIQAPGQAGVSIVISDDPQLQALNRQFLGVDAPTDVLSFPSEEVDPDTGLPYLGDILISVARARAQAEAAGHSLEAELSLLAVHGLLHLAGHDHADEQGKNIMWALQAQILDQAGFPSLKYPEDTGG